MKYYLSLLSVAVLGLIINCGDPDRVLEAINQGAGSEDGSGSIPPAGPIRPHYQLLG